MILQICQLTQTMKKCKSEEERGDKRRQREKGRGRWRERENDSNIKYILYNLKSITHFEG